MAVERCYLLAVVRLVEAKQMGGQILVRESRVRDVRVPLASVVRMIGVKHRDILEPCVGAGIGVAA